MAVPHRLALEPEALHLDGHPLASAEVLRFEVDVERPTLGNGDGQRGFVGPESGAGAGRAASDCEDGEDTSGVAKSTHDGAVGGKTTT